VIGRSADEVLKEDADTDGPSIKEAFKHKVLSA
jgi:hypothetical protein